MIDHLAVEKYCICVYVAKRSLKATKSFTHGGVVFDLVRRTVAFGKAACSCSATWINSYRRRNTAFSVDGS